MPPRKQQQPKRRKNGPRKSKGVDNISHIGVPADGRVVLYKNPMLCHRFVRSTVSTTLAKAAADQGYALNFTLNFISGFGDLTNLYDDYRIDRLEFVLTWQPGTTAVQLPVLDIVQDWDGSGAAPASSGELPQYASLQKVLFDTTHRTVCVVIERPFILVQTTVSASNMVRNAWVDVANVSEPFFGIRMWGWNYNSTTASGTIEYYWRAHMSLRGTR